jgi:hypothetical protein
VIGESKKRAHGEGGAEAERDKKRRKLNPSRGEGDAKDPQRVLERRNGQKEREEKRRKEHEVGEGERLGESEERRRLRELDSKWEERRKERKKKEKGERDRRWGRLGGLPRTKGPRLSIPRQDLVRANPTGFLPSKRPRAKGPRMLIPRQDLARGLNARRRREERGERSGATVESPGHTPTGEESR